MRLTVLNMNIALMNYFVYFSNIHTIELSTYAFLAEMMEMEKIEYEIASQRGKLEICLSKWESLIKCMR